MKTGISIYLSSPLQDIERTIEHGAAAGARYAFTSLHIPEDGGAAYADKVRHVLSLLSARGIALIADVGPRTCDLLGLERIEDLRDLGLEYLRLDYGFSAQRVAELSGVFHIVVNASTVSSDEIASWREAGADVTRFAACHNFYPKPYTGLALEDIARVNLRLAALGFEIMAFVPGDANVRGPVFEGLPTVEAQRGRASKVALNMLNDADAGCDLVRAARKLTEHGARLVLGCRLAQNLAVKGDDGVGRDRQLIGLGILGSNGSRLGACQALDKCERGLAVEGSLVDFCGNHANVIPCLAHQLDAAR